MCRLLAYLGSPITADRFIEKPEHSLIAQSYQPREMTAGLLNADGFGLGWYHPEREDLPYIYRNTHPIWSDTNLGHLTRYIESGCVLASVRSATPGLPVDLSNCQPFRYGQILGLHNGFIDNFRHTLYRQMRSALTDPYYSLIQGVTDSEHLFAYTLNQQAEQGSSLSEALALSLRNVMDWALASGAGAALNLIFSDGKTLVASRCGTRRPMPSLYWLQDDPQFPEAVFIASEPIFASEGWRSFPEQSILSVGQNREIQLFQL